MKTSLTPRLVMAPLACGLSLAALAPLSAAPSKKAAAAPPAPEVQPAPPAKTPFYKKLNPFRKKDPVPAPPTPAAPTKNSKKSAAAAPPSPQPGNPESTRPPAKNLATAKTLKPSPEEIRSAPAALPPVSAWQENSEPEPPKKAGFFSRLKAKLNSDPESVGSGEKPPRPGDWKERWVVTEDSTAFFEFGPSQASGPDLRLPRGQVVKLTQASRGWARVELEGGRQGYIGTDQIRQAAETDFAQPLVPAGSQIAATGGPVPKGWSPAAPMPDLPDLPMTPGMENSLLLLPPLEFEGTELKKGSMRLPADSSGTPTLNPGDALPANTAAPEPPSLELKPGGSPDAPTPAANATLPSPNAPAPQPAKADSDAKPTPDDSNALPPPSEPTAPPSTPEEAPASPTPPTAPATPAPAPDPAPAPAPTAPVEPAAPAAPPAQ